MLCAFIINRDFIMENRMYVSVEMMTALIFQIIIFDTVSIKLQLASVIHYTFKR